MNAKPIIAIGLSDQAACNGSIIQQDLDKKLADYHVLLYFTNNITEPKLEVYNAPDADKKTIEEIRQMIKDAMKC
jgi:hypothetical protein